MKFWSKPKKGKNRGEKKGERNLARDKVVRGGGLIKK